MGKKEKIDKVTFGAMVELLKTETKVSGDFAGYV